MILQESVFPIIAVIIIWCFCTQLIFVFIQCHGTIRRNIFVCGLNHSESQCKLALVLQKLKKMSSTSSSRLCNCFRSMWTSTVQCIVSQDESVRRRRRLLLGIVVLLMVDVLWVGSSELTDVRTNLILLITTLLPDSVRKLPPNT